MRDAPTDSGGFHRRVRCLFALVFATIEYSIASRKRAHLSQLSHDAKTGTSLDICKSTWKSNVATHAELRRTMFSARRSRLFHVALWSPVTRDCLLDFSRARRVCVCRGETFARQDSKATRKNWKDNDLPRRRFELAHDGRGMLRRDKLCVASDFYPLWLAQPHRLPKIRCKTSATCPAARHQRRDLQEIPVVALHFVKCASRSFLITENSENRRTASRHNRADCARFFHRAN